MRLHEGPGARIERLLLQPYQGFEGRVVVPLGGEDAVVFVSIEEQGVSM